MKILKLQTKHLQSHLENTIDLSKVNLFVGSNGSGKTTIANAISTILIGDLPSRPYREYITIGKAKAFVGAKIAVGDDTFGASREISGDKITLTGLTPYDILKKADVDKDVMRILTDSWHYTLAGDKTRADILSSILTVDLTIDEFIDKIPNMEHKNELCIFIRNNISRTRSKSQCETLYDKAYEARKRVKKEIISIDRDIRDANIELKNIPTLSLSSNGISEKAEEYSKIKKRKEELDKSIQDMNKSVTDEKKDITEQKKTTKVDELNMRKTIDDLDNMNKKVSILEATVRAISHRITEIESRNESDDVQCPYFGKCRYKNIELDIAEALSSSKKAKKLKETELDHLINAVQEKEKEANTEREKADALSKLKEREDQLKKDEIEIAKLEKERNEIALKIEEMERAGITSGEDPISIENEKRRSYLKARIEVLNENMTNKMRERDMLERAVSLFSNRSFISSLMTKMKEDFIEAFTSTCKLLIPRYKPEVSDSMEITLSGIPINTLSTSEKFRLGLSIQTAVAISSGIGIVLADGSDVVTDSSKMVELINKLGQLEGIETLIVLSSVDISDPNAGYPRSGIRSPYINVTTSKFRVESGKISYETQLFGENSW